MTSPESNADLGIVAKIELDDNNCKNEQVTANSSVIGESGEGRNDTGNGFVD